MQTPSNENAKHENFKKSGNSSMNRMRSCDGAHNKYQIHVGRSELQNARPKSVDQNYTVENRELNECSALGSRNSDWRIRN